MEINPDKITVIHHPEHFNPKTFCNIPEYWETVEFENPNGDGVLYGTSQISEDAAIKDLMEKF